MPVVALIQVPTGHKWAGTISFRPRFVRPEKKDILGIAKPMALPRALARLCRRAKQAASRAPL
jgi:hypothetical protein